ncbi:hypothetical protein CVE27_19210 [Pseudomonas syringae pv. actinidiae]|nr:hypothetical protein [Pseudomonas syringae pv. actinidiae]
MSVGYVPGSRHLFAPRRLTLKDQSKQNPRSVSGPTSSGSFTLTLYCSIDVTRSDLNTNVLAR